MKARFSHAKIKALASTLPSTQIHLDDELERLYNNDIKKLERIKKSVGLDTRHISDTHTTTFDLCLHSALYLFDKCGVDKKDIEAVIFVTISPDFLSPNNAHLLHCALNLPESCACFDISQACSGFVYGLYISFMMCESGVKNILLCVGDTVSKMTHQNDQSTASLIGDAGCALLIERTQTLYESFFNFYANGKEFENIIVPNSAFRKNAPLKRADGTKSFLFMDGAQMFSLAMQTEPAMIDELLEFSRVKIKNIDYVFFNQSNAYIINSLARHFGLKQNQAPTQSLAKYGYTGSASIPLAICEQISSEQTQNERILGQKNAQVLFSAFGVGVSLANALVNFDQNIQIFKPMIYNLNDTQRGYL